MPMLTPSTTPRAITFVAPSFHLLRTARFTTNAPTPRRMPLAPIAQHIQPPSAPDKAPPTTGQVRVRQHLNPLARRWSQPVHLPPDWYTRAYTDVSLPLVVDIGVAKGRFLLKLAQQDATCNYLGLEIREPLVHQANRCAFEAGLTNLFYVACNANVSFRSILSNVPTAVLSDVYIQFCDPWFKKRHAKRRIVNQRLVQDVFHVLQSACRDRARVFLQSDVLEVAVEMTSLFDAHEGFQRVGDMDEDGWLRQNPIGLPTEREIAVLNAGGSVYRALYVLR